MLLAILFSFQLGNAPVCAEDDFGNLECYYYSRSECELAISGRGGNWSCVRNR